MIHFLRKIIVNRLTVGTGQNLPIKITMTSIAQKEPPAEMSKEPFAQVIANFGPSEPTFL